MDGNRDITERERIMIWFLIPFILSCIALIAACAMAIAFSGILFMSTVSALYMVSAFCLFLLSLTCYMACFQHKRTAALSAAIISLFTFQWISAVLLFIGYDKQKKLDEEYGETWICNSCGTKEIFTQFLYPGMCVNCARISKNNASRILKQAKECIKLSNNKSEKLDKETVLKCLDEIEYVRDNRDEYPMVKRSLRGEIESLLHILMEIDPDNQKEYEERISKNNNLDEERKIDVSIRADIERSNKIMARVAIGIIVCFISIATVYAVFLGSQLSMLEQSINDLFSSFQIM